MWGVVDMTSDPTYSAPGRTGWTAGRVVSVVAGSLFALIAVLLVAGGVIGLVWNGTTREGDYLTSSTVRFASDGYAVSSDRIRFGSADVDWGWESGVLGRVRIRVASDDPGR